MIQISGLRKSFGRLEVLRGIDLQLASGRVTAILGPNGAGKSTLIKMLLGLSRPDSGCISIDGQVVSGDPSYRARIGYMAQAARLPENLTAAELLALMKALRGNPVTTDEELVTTLGLEGELNKPMRNLSGGTRQKVNAVLAFLFRPDLLVLDEPTAGLDPVASSTLKDRILEVRGERRTVLVTSHILSELEELADDVVFLLDGRVRFAGPLEALKQATRQHTLERAIARIMLDGGGLAEKGGGWAA